MIKNYFKVAIRNFIRHPFFSTINIFALTLSLSVCLIVITIIKDQCSFDNFNNDAKAIFRVDTKVNTKSGESDLYATSPEPLANKLAQQFSFTSSTTTLQPILGLKSRAGSKTFYLNGIFSGASFFDVFNFKLEPGSMPSDLNQPLTAILSKSTCEKCFGTSNAVGKFLQIDSLGIFKIIGVLSNPPEEKSHLKFDVLLSKTSIPTITKVHKIELGEGKWNLFLSNYTYIRVKNGTSRPYIAKCLQSVSQELIYFVKFDGDVKSYDFFTQRLSEITPTKGLVLENSIGMPESFIYTLSLIVAALLFLACFNYATLTIARALTRAKEIGVRKVNGASKFDIFSQLLLESIITSLISVMLAIALVPFVPLNSSLGNLFSHVHYDIALILYFFLLSVGVGVIAGAIPSLILSNLEPLDILKNKINSKVFKSSIFKKILTVSQFCFSLVFIMILLVYYEQTNFMVNADYGFNLENIITVRLNNPNNGKLLINKISQIPNVASISETSLSFGKEGVNNVSIKASKKSLPVLFDYYAADRNVIPDFQLKLVAGKNFSGDLSQTHESEVIINETAAQDLGIKSATEAIGRFFWLNDSTSVRIVGVLKDFKFQNFSHPITPMAMRFVPKEFAYLNIKLHTGMFDRSIDEIKKTWRQLNISGPFEYEISKKSFENQQSHKDDVLMVGFITLLFLVIACLGLLGMSALAAEAKIKEVTIRKVLGANTSNIFYLLSRDYLIMLMISGVIGIPIGYYIVNTFLNSFAYKVHFGVFSVLGSFILIFSIGLMTFGSQIVKLTYAPPTKNLQ